MNLNDKNAKKHFIQLANTNFEEGGLHLTAAYEPDELPKTLEDADKEARSFIRRISHRMEGRGGGPLKYICVTKSRVDNEVLTRVHHHIIINEGLDRETIEALWSREEKKGKEIGFINASELGLDELNSLYRYLTSGPQDESRWVTNILATYTENGMGEENEI